MDNRTIEQEKENLIKYLEDKINECEELVERLEGTNSFRIEQSKLKIRIYQEILDKVKEGKYANTTNKEKMV